MDNKEFFAKMKEKSKKININLSDDQVQKFKKYMDLLLEWNEKINLTAITDPDEVIVKHFVDSISIDNYINQGEKVLDIGTGAGFPGIPEKIVRQDIDILLMDSLNKRINFLQEVISEIKLEKISAKHGRAEEMAHNAEYREKFDVVVSRAVAPLNVLLEYMIPFVKVGGICICMKGSNIEEELQKSTKALQELGSEVVKIDNFNLPDTDIVRNLILIKKIKSTANKYPRKAGLPAKDPII